MKKKVCKSCKLFVEGNECPVCRTAQFSNNWKGRLLILDASLSLVAKNIGISAKGEYAIKVA
ncbi:DNA-directed RNA polymerase subunit E'' [Candidatus Woesearchaeota archaeon]|nr:DNA-directed RNA polymerase subunit E'' [Candidatus Woesearchaeota archaeon]